MLSGESGASQGVLLGILVVLLALFGYLYFFTGLITQRDVQQKSATPAIQSVKQPIPPRPAEGGKQEAAQAAGEKSPVAATAPAAPAPQQATTPPAAAPKPAPASAPPALAPKSSPPAAPAAATVKPAPAPPAPVAPKAPPAAKAPAAPPVAPKPAAAPPAAAKQPKAAEKPAVAESVQAAKQPAKATAPDPPTKPASTVKPEPVKAAARPEYRISGTGPLAADKAAALIATMNKGGLKKVEKKQVVAEKEMKRLYVAEFTDIQLARAELEKVKKVSSGAFLLRESGMFMVYAGSYDQQKRADNEASRLTALGVNATVTKARLSMPVIRITAVTTDKTTAQSWVKRLTRVGLAAESRQVGK